MMETEKKIIIENVDLRLLLGSNDSNLRLLESRFSASIFVRGEVVTIKGVDTEVDAIEKIFLEMIYVLKARGNLRQMDVDLIIELSHGRKPAFSKAEIDNIILYTKNDVIKTKTTGQAHYCQTANKNDICFAIGPAGTGKTYLAVAMAVAALKKGFIKKLILVRPAVEAGESLGFLPGDLRDKIDPYLRPLYDSLEDMMSIEKLKTGMEKGIIEIVPLAYMRGRTLNNAFVILDEAQNSTDMQMKMFLTRLGSNSRAIITGDITQIDLPPKTVSGLVKAQEILKNIQGIGFVYFDKSDVVRHRLVKDIINAYEKHYENL